MEVGKDNRDNLRVATFVYTPRQQPLQNSNSSHSSKLYDVTSNLPDGFTNLLYLTSVQLVGLEVVNNSNQVLLAFLQSIHLRRLKVKAAGGVNINYAVFEALTLSQLSSLSLALGPKSLESNAPMDETMKSLKLRSNKTVTFMKLRASDQIDQVYTRFMMYFNNLANLSVDRVNNDVLQSIICFQMKLRSLRLYNCNRCTIDGFEGGRLVQLNELEIWTVRNAVFNLFVNGHPKLLRVFPNIEYLYVRSSDQKIDFIGTSRREDRMKIGPLARKREFALMEKTKKERGLSEK